MDNLWLMALFMRIGVFGFGGGMAMLPLIFQSVQEFGIMEQGEFSNLIAISQITPGPIAVNAATYVGYNYGGIGSGAVATLGVVLPSFLIILLMTTLMERHRGTVIMEGMMTGIRPATIGLIGAAIVFIGQGVFVSAGSVEWIPVVMFFVTILLSGKWKLHPLVITLLMGGIGAIICG